MELNEFEEILAKQLLKDWQNSATTPSTSPSESLDPGVLKSEKLFIWLTSRLKSKTNLNAAYQSQATNKYEQFSKQSPDQEISTKSTSNPSVERNNEDKATSPFEELYDASQLPLLQKLHLKNMVNLGACDSLYLQISQTRLKKNFRKLALVHHPDHGGTSENFQSLCESYDELHTWMSAEIASKTQA